MRGFVPKAAKRRYSKTRAHQQYWKDGKRVPGCSTIAKIGSDPANLIHWAWDCGMQGLDYRKVRDQAADVGIISHFMIECFLHQEAPILDAFSKDDIKQAKLCFGYFLDIWEREKLEIISAEEQLVSKTLDYGGTGDTVGQGSARVLWDYKTSKGVYHEHFIQIAGLERLHRENHPETPIERVAVLRLPKQADPENPKNLKPTLVWKDVSDLDPYWELFKANLAVYHARKRLPKLYI